MDLSTTPVVVAPGLDGSGPAHWQSRWEQEEPGWVRTAPRSWDRPDCEDWLVALDRAADRAGGRGPVVVVAHSLGARAAVLWAARDPQRVAGLFCVAPPDLASLAEVGVQGFDHADRTCPPVPVLLVSSTDDPYATPAASQGLAGAWRAGHVQLDGLGHINADSGLGRWDQGRDLLTAFVTGL